MITQECILQMLQIYVFSFFFFFLVLTMQTQKADIFQMNSGILTSLISEHQWLDLLKISHLWVTLDTGTYINLHIYPVKVFFAYSISLKALLAQWIFE